jgi:sodium-independent sulfate anion transporter 11
MDKSGYPLTGAFSRTAIMARSGVKTPFAGVFAGAVVILALYVLTPAFYYIPEAILAAVVIHAVIDLVSKMSYIKGLWYTNKAELLVWISAVLVTVFVDVQTGIYAAVGLSLVIMLYNLTKPPVKVLARLSPDEKTSLNDYESKMESKVEEGSEDYMYADETDPNFATYIKELPRGIVCIKPCGPILYPNAEYISDKILRIVKRKTKPGNMTGLNEQSVNRPWSEEIPSQMEAMKMETLPVLRALLFDFGAVCRIDSTGLGMLVTLRDTVARHAGQTVEFHFSHLQGSSVREGLLRSGFGSLPCDTESIDSTSEYGISYSSSAPPPPSPSVHEKSTNKENSSSYSVGPIESAYPTPYKSLCKHVMQTPIDRYPCFHWNTNTAVQDICHRWSQSGKHESLDSAMI